MNENLPATGPAPVDRWEFIRDVAVFQLKLGLDALRDLVLLPVSLGAGLIDLFTSADRPRLFYEVHELGKRTDVWINLFGSHGPGDAQAEEGPVVDSLVQQVERLIVEQYERGGVTASAKNAIDRSLDGISRATRGR